MSICTYIRMYIWIPVPSTILAQACRLKVKIVPHKAGQRHLREV